jgi:hypothetical protein
METIVSREEGVWRSTKAGEEAPRGIAEPTSTERRKIKD